MMIMIAEMLVQIYEGIPIRAVVALSMIVNNVIEIAVDAMIVSGLARLLVHKDHPRITGRTGKIQGARILNIHATNESITREDIRYQ